MDERDAAWDESRLRAAIESIRQWKRRGQRAPHKPLLLLLALGRLQRGESREVAFTDVEAPLRRLLESYGPARKSYHPEYPFWRLQTDGLWHIEDADSLPRRRGNTNPPITALRERPAIGGFPPEVDSLLRDRPQLVAELARAVLDEHFPASYHADLLADVGLAESPARETTTRARRDPRFPRLVLRAYEYRCAVCGLDPHLDGRSVGLEAAHIRWHTHGGNSTVDNGLALCPLHHKALDLGAIGLDEDRRVLVSRRLTGGAATSEFLIRFHARPLLGPQAGEPVVDPTHIRWHTRQVFRGPPRAPRMGA